MKINIHELQIPVKLGCTAEERAFPQIVKFDIEAVIQGSSAHLSDDLNDTVDYIQICKTAEKVASIKEYKMLEHLVQSVASEVLELSSFVTQVNISAKKHILPTTTGISVQLSLSR